MRKRRACDVLPLPLGVELHGTQREFRHMEKHDYTTGAAGPVAHSTDDQIRSHNLLHRRLFLASFPFYSVDGTLTTYAHFKV